MKYSCEKWAQLANELLDEVFEAFGARWCISWAISIGLSDEEIYDIIIDDKELIAQIRKESEEIETECADDCNYFVNNKIKDEESEDE